MAADYIGAYAEQFVIRRVDNFDQLNPAQQKRILSHIKAYVNKNKSLLKRFGSFANQLKDKAFKSFREQYETFLREIPENERAYVEQVALYYPPDKAPYHLRPAFELTEEPGVGFTPMGYESMSAEAQQDLDQLMDEIDTLMPQQTPKPTGNRKKGK